MNRRYLAVIALLIAVPLFAGPLVSPIPDHSPHLQVSADTTNFSTEEEKEKRLRNATTMRYQNFSTSAQRLFDRATSDRGSDVAVRVDEGPKTWTTTFSQTSEREVNRIYVHKDSQYYNMYLYRFTPGPSLQAFMLRLGPFLGAIGLGTLAGYFILTAED